MASLIRASLALVLAISATDAYGQAYVASMYGVNFGGASGCPNVDDCTNSQTNVSLGGGVLGSIAAVELEVAYAPRFLGKADGLSSNAATAMGNVMLSPQAGPVRPYMLGGAGLVRTRIALASSGLGTSTDTDFIFSVGGGLMWFATKFVGLRGDLRYFHSFSEHPVAAVTLNSTNIDYSRISGGVVVRF